MDLLAQHQDEISWTNLSQNESIFEYNYRGIKERCELYKDELMAESLHPSRIKKLLDLGIDSCQLHHYI